MSFVPIETRWKIVRAAEAGGTYTELAKRFGVATHLFRESSAATAKQAAWTQDHAAATRRSSMRGAKVVFQPPCSPTSTPLNSVGRTSSDTCDSEERQTSTSKAKTRYAMMTVTRRLLEAWYRHCQHGQVY